MKFSIEVDDKTIRQLIFQYVQDKLGNEARPKLDDIKIKVQSKQNYRVHEWEDGILQVKYEGDI